MDVSLMIAEIVDKRLRACCKEDEEAEALIAEAEDLASDLISHIKEEIHKDLNRSDW